MEDLDAVEGQASNYSDFTDALSRNGDEKSPPGSDASSRKSSKSSKTSKKGEVASKKFKLVPSARSGSDHWQSKPKAQDTRSKMSMDEEKIRSLLIFPMEEVEQEDQQMRRKSSLKFDTNRTLHLSRVAEERLAPVTPAPKITNWAAGDGPMPGKTKSRRHFSVRDYRQYRSDRLFRESCLKPTRSKFLLPGRESDEAIPEDAEMETSYRPVSFSEGRSSDSFLDGAKNDAFPSAVKDRQHVEINPSALQFIKDQILFSGMDPYIESKVDYQTIDLDDGGGEKSPRMPSTLEDYDGDLVAVQLEEEQVPDPLAEAPEVLPSKSVFPVPIDVSTVDMKDGLSETLMDDEESEEEEEEEEEPPSFPMYKSRRQGSYDLPDDAESEMSITEKITRLEDSTKKPRPLNEKYVPPRKVPGYPNCSDTGAPMINCLQPDKVTQSSIRTQELWGIPEYTPLSKSELVELMHQIQVHPTNEHVYLMYVHPPSHSDFNPYLLKVVKSKDLNLKQYFTLSRNGVLIITNGFAQHHSLVEFEKEMHMYERIKKIKFFVQFRMWKAFYIWRHNIRLTKNLSTRKLLEEGLFMTKKPLSRMITELFRMCDKISGMGFLAMRPNFVYRIKDFITTQENRLNEIQMRLRAFESMVIEMTSAACRAAIIDAGFSVDEYADEMEYYLKGLEAPLDSVQKPTGVMDYPGQWLTYSLQAKKLKTCQRLTNFIHLVDYYVQRTYHRLLKNSMLALTCEMDARIALIEKQYLAPPKHTVKFANLLTKNEQQSGPVIVGHSETPIFDIGCNWQEDKLAYSPSLDEFKAAMRHVFNLWQEAILTYPNMLPNKIFDPFTQPIVNGHMKVKNCGPGPSMQLLIDTDLDLPEIFDCMDLIFQHGIECCDRYTNIFEDIRRFCVENEAINVEDFRSIEDVQDFAKILAKFSEQMDIVNAIEDEHSMGVFRINNAILRENAVPTVQRCLQVLHEIIPQIGAEQTNKLEERISSALRILEKTPTNADEYVDYLLFLDEMVDNMEDIEKDLDICSELYDLIEQYGIPVDGEELKTYAGLQPMLLQLRNILDTQLLNREKLIQELIEHFRKDTEEIFKDVETIRQASFASEVLDKDSDPEKMRDELAELKARLEKHQERANKFNQYQKQLKLEVTNFEALDELLVDVKLRHQLWHSITSWNEAQEEWDNAPFNTLDHEEITKEVNKFLKSISQLEKGLPPNELVPILKEKVEATKALLPIIANLHNPNLKRRHWDELEKALGRNLTDDSVTLKALKESNFELQADFIQEVSSQASAEYSLEALLKKVEDSWKDVDFVVLPHKDQRDVFILGGTDDIQILLDDSNIHMTTIASSRHVGPIKHKVDEWVRLLDLFARTLDEWLTCQKSWIYLESIFSAPDIQRQLPNEAKMFGQVDKSWKDIMSRTNKMPAALRAATQPGLLEVLQTNNELLDQIMKCLDDYLESKRSIFPRFYFLSNEELLEILAQTRNPQAVQPHLRKCFDAIQRLEFGGPASAVALDVLAMVSPEDERVALTKGLKARGNVEEWLGKVEDAMFNSLKRIMRNALTDYHVMEREEWITKFPSQCVLTTSQLMWAQRVHEILDGVGNRVAGMEAFEKKNFEDLNKLAAMVRGQLPVLVRTVLCALITIDVHARDIITSLVQQKVESSSNFEWLKQLRYYWDPEAEIVVTKMANAMYNYGYEYLGAATRLVITPLTDRCYLCLMGALQLDLGGAPAGPAGTGKTETTKDLAKSLAFMCVVFNCSDGLDYKMMGRFFSGLAQSGGWCCFDEFNRIEIEVLSVIAQQLITIRMAKVQRLTRFMFEGREIKLVRTCAAFITMNPGYAGRTELPDNLKALFRPISMMVPDYTLIAEVILYSEGFESSKILAHKMTQMYKLCSEQLSQQDHYDFGMRAVKSVLVMAGTLKRANPTINENIVLIRALRDSNLPKFLAHDAILLQGIIQDLFPGVVIPEQDYGILQEESVKIATEKGLEAPECFIRKIIQLFDTLMVRHGVMLVGPTGGGKTTIYNVLKGALTSLGTNKQLDNPQFRAVETYIMNPKAVSLGELYGQTNPITLEWKDGLMGIMVRNAVKPKMTFHQWVICDGPVDAVWIENMNTVLDDNKMLCLANSERIKLTTWVRMMFEVQDLAQASPATVSRCGMVYVDSKEMGWLPYVKSWLRQAKLGNHEDVNPLILGFFERHVDNALDFISKNCQEMIPQAAVGKVAMVCKLLEAIFLKDMDLNLEKPKFVQFVLQIFVFGFVWGLGGNLNEGDHDKFDRFVRKEFEAEPHIKLPKTGLLYQYFTKLDTRKMEKWDTIVPTYVYNPSISFVDVLVPTVDTIRYGYLLELMLSVDRAVLLTGQTGTGKSAIAKFVLADIAPKNNYIPTFLNFSAQTTSKRTQEMIEGKLEKRKKALMSAPFGKKVIVFVDDLNMPKLDKYGAQPALELLRQLMDFNGCYDRNKMFWKELQNVILSAACAPPGGGRNPITPRLIRHFGVLAIPTPYNDVLVQIYRAILRGFMEDFPADLHPMADKLVNASIDVYQYMSKTFLPTPSKSHYLFNMRDLSKCVQGILQATKLTMLTANHFIRLFYHEACRVFHDRLTDDTDRNTFTNVLKDICKKTLQSQARPDSFDGVMFGDFLKPGLDRESRVYEEITNKDKLKKILTDYLDEYNIMMSREMDLVFFSDAIEHITRIARILRTDRGNALLVGVGGAGKQSLTRLATYISGYKCFQIELMRGYDYEAFHDDLKKLNEMAGMNNERVTFLFTDTQIAYEEFLEDINNMLNSGEVPNLLEPEDQERMISSIRADATEAGIADDNRDALWDFFIRRLRANLHIVLCMSPVGESFRVRCRMFPSLVNCCTINWFTEWPGEALLSVAELFISKIDLGTPSVGKQLALMCVYVHESVTMMADRYYEEMRRKFYTTPSSYLELINLFTKMLSDQREKIQMGKARIQNGLSKLLETNVLVKEMRVQLKELEPVLRQKSEAVENLMIKLAEDQGAADIVRRNVQEEEAAAKEKAIETQAIAEDAQKDLATALPALEAAVKALDALDNKDIAEVRGFQKPPKMVEMVMESVCVLFNRQADWATAKLVLTDANFMKKLENFDKDNVSEATQRKLKVYVDNPNFQPEIIGKVSKACKSICIWVRAIDGYIKVYRNVEPKRNRYLAAKAELDQVMETLQVKQAQLNEVEKKIRALQELFDNSINEKQQLEDNMELTAARLKRAGRLTSALASEQTRWQESVKGFDESMKNITGDVFVGAACIAYFGVFTNHYRQMLVKKWSHECKKLRIPVTENFSLANLADPFEVRVWNAAGLPKDMTSTENAVLATRGRRWPLMIDPQDQAIRWVKQMEAARQLKVLKLTDGMFMITMENCIRLGTPCLLEEVGEELDPSLEPVLLKHTFVQNGRLMIRLGDTDIDYDADFRLYMTTKLSNPHFLPDVCIKVTLINFTVTMEGLEDQLLSEVVGIERPDLETQRSTLVASINADKNQLISLESKILKLLFQSEGNILDDEELIEALNDSKKTSVEITKRLKEAEDTEVRISGAREKYRMLAARGSVLYFVVAQLSSLDPMYHFSLKYFTQVFIQCIGSLEKTDGELEERLKILVGMTTLATYTNISRGLFEKDKLVFSFLLCTEVLRSQQKLPEDELSFFIRGAIGSESKRVEKPGSATWLTSAQWNQLCDLESTFGHFSGIKNYALTEKTKITIGNYEVVLFANVDVDPFAFDYQTHAKSAAPVSWSKKLTKFQKLLLIKACAEEKLVAAMTEYVRTELGDKFIESPSIDLMKVYKDMNKATPLVFILSVGSDPMAGFQKLAAAHRFQDRIASISLGQGQGPIAESMINSAVLSGDWVFLQNCHLAASWMPSLERIVQTLIEMTEEVSDSFRLYLSSMPTKSFPVSVLQDSVKITNEPPKGMKANVRQALLDMDKKLFEDNILGKDWRRILFGVCFFHAVIQERKKFGPLGWNIKYEFNDSDRNCTLLNLDMFCSEGRVPWDALEYITSQITYGGRITDGWDQRCLTHILKIYFSEEALAKGHKFSASGIYYAPALDTVKGYLDYVDGFPLIDEPEIFGMHENANITYQRQAASKILDSLEAVQPRQSTGKASSHKDELALDLAKSFEDKLPQLIDLDKVGGRLIQVDKLGRAPALSIFLRQEVERFNKLLKIIRESLGQLKKGIKGQVVMSEELEKMYHSFLNNKVPEIWTKVAYGSTKSLGSWFKDLTLRLNFISSWYYGSVPSSYWLSGFFFQQGFLTAVLQTHARKYSLPIDQLYFTYFVVPVEKLETTTPDHLIEKSLQRPQGHDGVLVHGLYLDAARWDMKAMRLDGPYPGIMNPVMPVIHFLPAHGTPAKENVYSCPLYKTPERAGVLSTTGHSTNFIVAINLPTKQSEDYWILKGTALLSQLSE